MRHGDDVKRYLTFPRSLLRARLRRTDRPRLLTYIVTFTCNARCVMCDSWRKPNEDLSLAELDRIFAQLPQLDAVRLSGGEPFVRKDLPEIVELVRGRLSPLLLHITSNGFLSDRIVQLCETRDRSLPLQLLISIDGVGDKHDRVRGIAHAYDRAICLIHNVRGWGYQYLVEPVRDLGVGVYGVGSPNGLLPHSHVKVRLSNALAMDKR